MRARRIIGAVAVAAACLCVGGLATAEAQAATTCTWGGTPDAPTGTSTNSPGITNIPSPVPMKFKATGVLGGGCSGTFTFTGQMDAGSTCSVISFEGTAKGIPGVVRFVGNSVLGVAPARLYDREGNIVGSENAQFLNGANPADCLTPEGLTFTKFSSVIELF
jgi:hypothetical protein